MGASLHFYFSNRNLVPIDSDLSLTYSNCGALLSVLGFSFDHEESMSAQIPVQEFLDACERYLKSEIGLLVDRGTPTVQEGNWIFCGRSENYFQVRIELARQMAIEARDKRAEYCMFL